MRDSSNHAGSPAAQLLASTIGIGARVKAGILQDIEEVEQQDDRDRNAYRPENTAFAHADGSFVGTHRSTDRWRGGSAKVGN